MQQEWMKFVNTGKVSDYLNYSMACESGHGSERASDMKERERENGADHCTYRYGVDGDTHRGF